LAVALFLALAALGERKNSLQALLLAIFGNLFAFLSITTSKPGLLYIIGLIVSSLIALEAFRYIMKRRTIADLLNYHGLYQQFPLAGTVLMIGVLGIVSFPISSTFFGEDILLNLSFHSGFHYLIIFQLIFIIIGIALIRFYSLVMFGKRDNAMKDIHLDLSPRQTFARLLIFALGNLAAFLLAFN
jgi:NADH-quinone oxidoreductase subunit L